MDWGVRYPVAGGVWWGECAGLFRLRVILVKRVLSSNEFEYYHICTAY